MCLNYQWVGGSWREVNRIVQPSLMGVAPRIDKLNVLDSPELNLIEPRIQIKQQRGGTVINILRDEARRDVHIFFSTNVQLVSSTNDAQPLPLCGIPLKYN